jgi:diaminopimelate epimerase
MTKRSSHEVDEVHFEGRRNQLQNLRFTKMSGSGNDFVFVEPESDLYYPAVAKEICARGHSLGADGVVVADRGPPVHASFFNPDGSMAEMCGNAAMCLARLAHERWGVGPDLEVVTHDWSLRARVDGVQVAVALPHISQPTSVSLEGLQCSYLEVTGVPHAVFISSDVLKLVRSEFEAFGRRLCHDSAFPKGANISVIEASGTRSIKMRTYERGVEAETLACGTGAAAAAVVAEELFGLKPPLTLVPPGGLLRVSFERDSQGVHDLWVEGTAKFIAEGIVHVAIAPQRGR